MACAKHFAAYGAPQAGRDYHTVDMSQVTLFETYLPPYKACVDAGAGSVMTSFNEIDGVPSTSNHWLLTDLLRKQWGFRGFVVTDYTSINELVPHGVAENISEAAMLAMNAGVDMDMQGSTFLNSLEALSAGNRINTGRIEEAVRLVLEAKARLGLFEDPYRYCDKKRESSEIMTTGNLSFARKMAAESCVLLKNEGNTLPIPPPVKKLAIIGPLADAKREMLGNWSAAGEWEKCVTLLEGMRNKLGSNTEVSYLPGCNTNDDDRSGFAAAVELAGKADYVILALGENGWMSGEASSRSSIDLPGVQLDLAAAIAKTGKPIVAVLFNGRPLALEKLHQLIPAILEAWFGGTEAGNGIADVLTGEVNPSGKLTMTFPRNTGQIPLFYNMKNTGRPYSSDKPSEKYVSRYLDCPNDPLYPFGFGLSYTSFDYSALKVNVDGEQIIVSVTVTNSGKRAGEEIVQLYVRDMKGTLTRPVRELKGFRKIHIGSGGTETITFILTRNDLAFYHTDLTRYYEPGSFTVFVGKNSAETLSTTFTLP
jgi:beta-glucosidase